jgi:choline dehydrogenase
MTHADVVVVGAGTSGATLASRLSDDPDRSVLLLEAGPDFPNEAVDPPALVVGGNLIGGFFAGVGSAVPEHDWGYYGQPLNGGRRVHLWRGRLVGGTSMINGCIAVRAKPSDFDAWEAAGATGWGWRDVEPCFQAVEREVPIKRYPRERWQPFQTAFVDGLVELGFRDAADINAPDSWDGVTGAWPQNRRNEIRQGALMTYVRRARDRPNFAIVDRAIADRVTISGGRAAGVRYVRDGEAVEIEADLVVLAGGAYGSPAILLRSGIGPADDLRALGVEVEADLPVGRGLRDHPQTLFQFDVPPALAEMAGPGLAVVGRGDGWWAFPLSLDEETGVCAIAMALTSQEPQGTVTLASLDPDAPPLIDHRSQEVIDRGDFDSAWGDIKELCATSTFRELGVQRGDLEQPLEDTLRERLGTAFHPACSCAIGSVVDERLRVLGIEGLRVADASVFPANVTNNTNLTCFMVGERAAALIDEDTRQ